MLGFARSHWTGVLVALGLLVVASSLPARSRMLGDESPSGRISLDYTQRFLSDEYSAQNVFGVSWLGYLTEESDVTLFYERASQFSQTDQTVGGGYYVSPVPLVEVKAGGNYSSSHNVVPKTSGFLGMGLYPDRPLFLDLTVSRTDYDTPLTESLSATLGWSESSYQLLYTASTSRIEEGNAQYSHTLAYDYYSVTGSRRSVSISGGEQPREVSGETTLTTEYYSISISGFTPIDPDQSSRTGVVFGVTATTLVDEYDSLGFNLGFQREF